MPLTPAHAAVAWPVRALWPRAPIAAIAIGAMSPDFIYLLQLSTHGPYSQLGHTVPALVWFCVPTSMFVWAVFRRWVRPMLVGWLPPGLAASVGDGPSWRLAVVGVAIGAVSHLVWDGFTHEYGWAVTRIPALTAFVWPGVLPQLRWYKLLQHASTLFGGLAIVLAIGRWVQSHPRVARADTPDRRRRAWRGAATVITVGVTAAIANAAYGGTGDLAQGLMLASIGGMVGVAATLVWLGVAWGGLGVRPGSHRGRTGV